MDEEARIRALATRFFDAIEAGDIAAVRDCYAGDAVVWHNTDGRTQTADENVGVLRGFIGRIPRRVYANRRLAVFAGGFVQQHELQGTRVDGAKLSLSCCIVCEVRDDRIVRLDEYFDSAQVALFRKVVR